MAKRILDRDGTARTIDVQSEGEESSPPIASVPPPHRACLPSALFADLAAVCTLGFVIKALRSGRRLPAGTCVWQARVRAQSPQNAVSGQTKILSGLPGIVEGLVNIARNPEVVQQDREFSSDRSNGTLLRPFAAPGRDGEPPSA